MKHVEHDEFFLPQKFDNSSRASAVPMKQRMCLEANALLKKLTVGVSGELFFNVCTS
jgi:hypothetical protein